MNGIDSVSDGSNRIHLNSVVNSEQAVYSTVLPSSLMVFLYYVSDTFCTFQNGMENPDMEFVQKFTPPDFQVKNFTPSILLNFNSFSKKKNE